MSGSIGNGRGTGSTPSLDGAAAADGERRPRARRKSHGESFASALDAQSTKKPGRGRFTQGRGARAKSEPGPDGTAVAVVLAGAAQLPVAARPMVPAAPEATLRRGASVATGAEVAPRGNALMALTDAAPAMAGTGAQAAARPALPTARGTLDRSERQELADGTHDGAPAGHDAKPHAAHPAADGRTDAAALAAPEADPAAPQALAEETTQPSPLAATFAAPRGRDTVPESHSAPARAVTAADLEHIQIADLPRAERDTSPAPHDGAAHTTPSTLAALAGHAGSHGHLAAETNAANPTIPPPFAADVLPDPELIDRPRGVVGADGADLRLGGGDDSISLRITAEKHVVRVHATAADAVLADALRASADELRQALGAHGLELAELSASTGGAGGGASSGQGGGAGGDVPGGDTGETTPASSSKETRPNRKRGWVA